jgi:hypothetical protein
MSLAQIAAQPIECNREVSDAYFWSASSAKVPDVTLAPFKVESDSNW